MLDKRYKLCFLMETTSSCGALGLYSVKDGNIQAISLKTWEQNHSEFLNTGFAYFFEEGLISRKDLKSSFLALGVGPGRWTGTRIGVSFAKTLNFVSQVPIYPLSSLKILAESQSHQKKPILVLLNGFKNSLYLALYQKTDRQLKEVIAPTVIKPSDLPNKIKTPCLVVGDGYEIYESYWSKSMKSLLEVKNNTFPAVSDLARYLNREGDPSQFLDWKTLAPVYLRSPVPTLK